MDIDYLDGLLNYDFYGGQHTVDNYSFNVGGIAVDIDKNYDSMTIDNGQILDNTQNLFDNSAVFDNSAEFYNSKIEVDNSRSFDDSAIVNNYIGGNSPASQSAGGVTVNFNAFNEIHPPSADVDSVMTAFGEKLAEAVALAAEKAR